MRAREPPGRGAEWRRRPDRSRALPQIVDPRLTIAALGNVRPGWECGSAAMQGSDLANKHGLKIDRFLVDAITATESNAGTLGLYVSADLSRMPAEPFS